MFPTDLKPLLDYPLKLCAATTVTTYGLSIITGNVSQVDRIWTFMPTLYTAYWALLPLWPTIDNRGWRLLVPYVPGESTQFARDFSPRALLMLGIMVLWTLRLSYNTWRRGLFRLNDEDYRWVVLRAKVPTWLFQVINLTFIAVIQNLLLLLIATPALIAAAHPTPLTTSDGVLAFTALALLAWEFTADNQQFAYHAWKHKATVPYDARAQWLGARLAWTSDDAARGFCTRGLWAWSRHPNFFAEQSIWGVLNLIPLVSLRTSAPEFVLSRDCSFTDALQTLVPLAPSLALCLLFLSSTQFTESISASKYPRGYAAYRSRVAMFVPMLTPVWGALLRLTGGKAQVEELVWGKGAREAVAGNNKHKAEQKK
jgi:steroid 5-alpha reductase family enzyme